MHGPERGVEMAMIKCPDCGKDVSDQATTCINCGRPLAANPNPGMSSGAAQAVKDGSQRSKLRYDLGSGIGLLGAILGVIIGAVSGSFAVGIITAFVIVGIGLLIAYK